MKQSVTLRTASVLSVLFFMIHLVDDISRGFEKGGPSNLAAVPIFGVWLYGTLVLGERRSGYIIMLLGGLFGLLVPIAHMRGKGLGVAALAGPAEASFSSSRSSRSA